ncbi:MAG: hypothetical protein HUJ51_02300 [Eggerthellaceae bacterium]|nr:hypothetical protein [Eggerthellaceae bacterium]
MFEEESITTIGLVSPLDVGINGIGLMPPAGAVVVSVHVLEKGPARLPYNL